MVLYTLADKDTVLNLLRHSDPLKETFDLSFWHDDPVISGQPWKNYFESRVYHADIILLMLSDEFLDTQFIKQPEFKAVIDRHREKKAIVIPVVINNCRWENDFKSTDSDFNLDELPVLPKERKPIVEWDSTDQACKGVVEGIKAIIAPFIDGPHQEDSKNEIVNEVNDSQEEISSTEEGETGRMTEENDQEEKGARAEDRIMEDEEAKSRAEAAKRIMEAAEASAKRRAEEDRLWEEAMARRIAEKERRIREGIETPASSGVEEKNKEIPKKEEETRKITAEENKIKEKTEAAAILKARQEAAHRRESEAKRKADVKKQIKLAADAKVKEEGAQPKQDINIKKILIRGSLITLLVVAGIWIFSISNTEPEEEGPALEEINASESKDSIVLEKASDPSKKVDSSTNLGIGDIYNGGIIFVFNRSDNTGKIAHLDDAGPMPWQDAAKIHEQLGEGWRLPTFDELEIMYQTIGPGATNSGEFTNGLYWSATDYDEYQARLIRFSDGNTSYHYNKNVAHRKFRVRAIRDLGR